MFKKFFKKSKGSKQFIIGFLIGAMLFGSVDIFGNVVEYIFTQSNWKLVVDGNEYVNPDIPINLFVKEGYNYAPLAVFRDICLKLNIPFEADNITKEIRITTTGKEETVLSETTTPLTTETTTTLTTETPTNNLITYEENGITVTEISTGEKFVEFDDIVNQLKGTQYRLNFYGVFRYKLQKINNEDKYEDISGQIRTYNYVVDYEYTPLFNNKIIYISYQDYIQIIKPVIE